MVYIDRFKKLEEAEERRRQEEEERARKMKEQVSVCYNQPIKAPVGRKLYIISCINHIFLICCGFFFLILHCLSLMNKYSETKHKCSRMAVFQMVYLFWNDNFHAVSAFVYLDLFFCCLKA